ncbi:MAG: GNAT family N-acetyltransferase [Muricomes sp.]
MIRELRPEDRELYLKMAHDFYHSAAVLHPIPDSYLELTFEECMRGGVYAKLYVLEWQGELAGYGLISKTFSQEAGGYVCWLEELYIMEKYRGKGLGSEFFEYLEENLEEGVKRFRLEVEEDNFRARQLYERLGYKNMNYYQMVKEMQ